MWAGKQFAAVPPARAVAAVARVVAVAQVVAVPLAQFAEAPRADLSRLATACEQRVAGTVFAHWEPANTVTSLAFVVAGLAILARTARTAPGGAGTAARWWYGALVAAVGVGSVIQHGPHPQWQAYAHDLTLTAVLAFVAADALGDLRDRRAPVWWWLAPTAAAAPLVAAGPGAATAGQVAFAAVAIGLSLLRVAARPRRRRTLLVALALLATGSAIGTLGERTAWCQPDSLLQGHAVWHVLAAVALWWLAPVVGARPQHGSAVVTTRPTGRSTS